MKKFFCFLFTIISVIMNSAICFAVDDLDYFDNKHCGYNLTGWFRWICNFFAIISFIWGVVMNIVIGSEIASIDKADKENENIVKLYKSKKRYKVWGMIVIPIVLFCAGFLVDTMFITIDKPIIYLYPEHSQEISVKLGLEDKITVSYPKYKDSWEVKAEPNGDLLDLETGRKLYALYYESEAVTKFKIEDEGFVIKGEDSAKFLEEKLELLGLNYKEAEEFIVYWLPKLETNKYNYIRFASAEEIERNMPLEVSKNPDSVIRVMMTYKGLNRPIEVKEQEIITPERNGFVVVEWGGTEIR